MTKDFLPIWVLGFLILGATIVGLSGIALITVINPGAYGGVMRFLIVLVVSSGVVVAAIWAGAASAMTLRLRLRRSD